MSSSKGARSSVTRQELLVDPVFEENGSRENPGSMPRSGWISFVTEDGQVFVSYEGNRLGPVRARIAHQLAKTGGDSPQVRPVLLIFEGGDPLLPIVVGDIHERLIESKQEEVNTGSIQKRVDLTIDGHRVVLQAQEEIVLRCGKGSISLRKNGKIIIKGTDLLSRSAGQNKIKGSSVAVN